MKMSMADAATGTTALLDSVVGINDKMIIGKQDQVISFTDHSLRDLYNSGSPFHITLPLFSQF